MASGNQYVPPWKRGLGSKEKQKTSVVPMASGNSKEMEAAKRDFTQRNDDNGWSYPLIFMDESKPTDEQKKIVFVNRSSLAEDSPVFEKIFFDPSYIDSSKSELVMTNRSFDDFLEFVNVIAIIDKPEDRKPIDVDNLELMIRFADEYDIGSLMERCAAFAKQLAPTLRIYDKEQRDTLGRLFAICVRTNNTAILADDIAANKISRYPYTEIYAMNIDEEVLLDLLKKKMERYAQLRRPFKTHYRAATAPPPRDKVCVICKAVGGVKYYCRGCWSDVQLVNLWYCLGCWHTHHVPFHSADSMVHLCIDCQQPFLFSSADEPDKCECSF